VKGRRFGLVLASLLLHVGFLAAVGLIPVPDVVEQVMITMRVVDAPPPEPPAAVEAVEEGPGEAAPEPAPVEQAAAEPPPPPPQTEPPRPRPRPDQAAGGPSPASAGGDGPPAFGVVLSGGGGVGGVAVAVGRPDGVPGGSGSGGGGASEAPAEAPAPRILEAAPSAEGSGRSRCQGESRGPRRPRGIRRPDYPPAALEAGVGGRVRVRLQVDESGTVVSAEAEDRPGYGLEEAAEASLLGLRLEPALRCGRPVPGDAVIAVRFEP
jgi:protein TonB